MYKNWLKASRYISIFGYVSTIFLNTLLIVLTGWFLKRKLGTYKHLIIIFSVIGIVFESFGVVFQPMVLFANSGFMGFLNVETQLFSRNSLTNILIIYNSIFYSSTSFLAVMFIHRYFSVVKPAQLFHFQQKRITLWILYSFITGLMFYISCRFFCEVDNFATEYFSEEMLNSFERLVSETPAISIIIRSDGLRWKDLTFLISTSLIFHLQNAIITQKMR
ncbi:unnamed protein product [Caenorhabditis angaria]|uniref:7TM GPCR serpentine receptor class x (Srx) domain-containing protein n=1 Tax=Caenorhabditis angaria TaxID=860376 RepID=A0A9P1IZ76_9PELO|nr:unnamed protein product [Caenorhabditis angaria]